MDRKDGAMIVASGTGSIRTKDYFGDCQLHIEFKTPTPGKDNTLQMKGNSGIMLQSVMRCRFWIVRIILRM